MDLTTIWKFELTAQDEQWITLPAVSKPLTVQIQRGKPCVWFAVNPESVKVRLCIRTFATGHKGVGMGDMEYIGTYQLGVALVFHVFAADAESL